MTYPDKDSGSVYGTDITFEIVDNSNYPSEIKTVRLID